MSATKTAAAPAGTDAARSAAIIATVKSVGFLMAYCLLMSLVGHLNGVFTLDQMIIADLVSLVALTFLGRQDFHKRLLTA